MAYYEVRIEFWCDWNPAEILGLCRAVEVCVYEDPPLIKQPFWDVEAVPVSLAPVAELSRGGIGLWHQV